MLGKPTIMLTASKTNVRCQPSLAHFLKAITKNYWLESNASEKFLTVLTGSFQHFVFACSMLTAGQFCL